MHTYSILYIIFVISMFVFWNWFLFIKTTYKSTTDIGDACLGTNLMFGVIYGMIGLWVTIDETEPKALEKINLVYTTDYVSYQLEGSDHIYTETEAKFVNNDFKHLQWFETTLWGFEMECSRIEVAQDDE